MSRFSDFIRERKYLANVSPATVSWYEHAFKWLPSESPTQPELKDVVLRMREAGLKETGCNAAIRAINNNSAALDLYAFLAYRLHSLTKPTPVSWGALKAQFGTGVGRMDNFRTRFIDSLKLTLAVYREAKVEVEERGLILYPSPPPVQAKERGALR